MRSWFRLSRLWHYLSTDNISGSLSFHLPNRWQRNLKIRTVYSEEECKIPESYLVPSLYYNPRIFLSVVIIPRQGHYWCRTDRQKVCKLRRGMMDVWVSEEIPCCVLKGSQWSNIEFKVLETNYRQSKKGVDLHRWARSLDI